VLSEHDWTPELTAARLVEAFRQLPGRGVYSPAKGDFRNLGGAPIRGLIIISFAQECLGRSSKECVRLLTWARVTATHAAGADASINEICREFGWSRTSFDRHRDNGLRRLADCLQAAKERLEAA
jgi:hypothetical protein